jgi:hypothetical protein
MTERGQRALVCGQINADRDGRFTKIAAKVAFLRLGCSQMIVREDRHPTFPATNWQPVLAGEWHLSRAQRPTVPVIGGR